MNNNDFCKNQIYWIKDVLIIKYEGVKKPRPYLILYKFTHHVIVYPFTSKSRRTKWYIRIPFKINNSTKKSFIKITNSYIILKNNEKYNTKFFCKINNYDKEYIIKNIKKYDLAFNNLKNKICELQKLEINFNSKIKNLLVFYLC